MRKAILFLLCFWVTSSTELRSQPESKFSVLVIYENGGHHLAYSKAARIWLDQLAADSSFPVDYNQPTDVIDEVPLNKYQLVIPLDYSPYGWSKKSARAFQDYIIKGMGG